MSWLFLVQICFRHVYEFTFKWLESIKHTDKFDFLSIYATFIIRNTCVNYHGINPVGMGRHLSILTCPVLFSYVPCGTLRDFFQLLKSRDTGLRDDGIDPWDCPVTTLRYLWTVLYKLSDCNMLASMLEYQIMRKNYWQWLSFIRQCEYTAEQNS